MDLLASGRDADVFALEQGRVLRRYRDGRSAHAEAETLRAVVGAGFPAPAVHATRGPDIVMDRVDGPTLGAALLDGTTPVGEAGTTLARLHAALHAIEVAGGTLIHLDLHPLNVILSASGPVVIDWTDARPGLPGLDVAMTALICAQVALRPETSGLPARLLPAVGARMSGLLRAFTAEVAPSYVDHLQAAGALRRTNPTLSPAEVALIDDAVALAAAP